MQVVLIMGYFQDCRSLEHLDMKIGNIDDWRSVMVVVWKVKQIPFTMVEENEFSALCQLRKYMFLRPSDPENIFLTYRKKRKNTFGKIPSEMRVSWVCRIQKLSRVFVYGGLLSLPQQMHVSASITRLKRHGGWYSSTVIEEYLAESMKMKNKAVS